MKFTFVVDINSTPEIVFSWIGTPERAMEWQSNISRTEILQATPDMIGTTFRETIEEDGRSVEMQGTVTDYQQNRVLAMELGGKYNNVEVEYRLEDMGRYTRLTMSSNIQFRSYLKILVVFLWPFFKSKLVGQLNREYARLKELCERDTLAVQSGEGNKGDAGYTQRR